MHSMGLVHGDIKPGNVLVFESEEHGLHAKLADFGFTAGEVVCSPAAVPTVNRSGLMAKPSLGCHQYKYPPDAERRKKPLVRIPRVHAVLV